MNDVLCDTEYLQLKVTETSFNGSWVYAHRPNASDVVVILPCTDEEILFLIEERPPLVAENKGKYIIGIPAGLVGDERINETTLSAIEAELLEETGLVSEKIKIVGKNIASSAGCVSETSTIAIVKIVDKKFKQVPVDDNGIIKKRIWVKKTEVYNWLKTMNQNGYSISGQALAALYFYMEENNK